jgi:hypothetical protein
MSLQQLNQAIIKQTDLREVTAHVTAAVAKRLEPGTWTVRGLVKSHRLVRDPGYPDPFGLAGVWLLDGKKLIEVLPRVREAAGRTRRAYKEL